MHTICLKILPKAPPQRKQLRPLLKNIHGRKARIFKSLWRRILKK